MSETTILLVRHGETDWNRDRRVQGHADVPLNTTGRHQAAVLAASLARERFDAVYASDLRRAVETALLVAEPRGLEVLTARALRERNFGTWESLTDDEARLLYPAQTADGRAWGDGETHDEMAARVREAVLEIGGVHPGESVLVVTHGGPLRALLRHVGRGGDGPLENCATVRIAVQETVIEAVD